MLLAFLPACLPRRTPCRTLRAFLPACPPRRKQREFLRAYRLRRKPRRTLRSISGGSIHKDRKVPWFVPPYDRQSFISAFLLYRIVRKRNKYAPFYGVLTFL